MVVRLDVDNRALFTGLLVAETTVRVAGEGTGEGECGEHSGIKKWEVPGLVSTVRSDKGDLTSVDLSQTRELALVHRCFLSLGFNSVR